MNKNWLVGIIILIIIIIAGFYFFGRSNVTPPSRIISNPTITMQPSAIPVTSSPTMPSTSPASQSQSSKVDIKNMSFSPDTMTVKMGTTITWTNNDSVPHTVTSDNGLFDSKTFQPGDTFSFTFKQAGTFPYHCSIHTFMHGTITVTQ
ncbi:MAG: cupredoxin family copper-binding protein [Actinobacteria bacterium]|nr:cupredoxin family copper-binding protein [Actinomycetota bacterium]